MIEEAIKKRNEKQEQSRNLCVQMKPEFESALKSCLTFSSMYFSYQLSIGEKGRSAALLKSQSKRKRKKNEIEEVKEEEKQLMEDKQQFLMQVKRLKMQQQMMEQQMN